MRANQCVGGMAGLYNTGFIRLKVGKNLFYCLFLKTDNRALTVQII